MLEAGLHFGHQTFRWNPKMHPFIFTARDGVHIIDLTKTELKLQEALDFIAQKAASGVNLLLIGTKRQASGIIKELAGKAEIPFVSMHWPGGLLTNFQTIKKRIIYLEQLREKVKTKDFGEMTKKEIGLLEKELANLEESFGGLSNLKDLPGVIFIVDVVREKIALKEALKLGIPVVAIVDTNANPTGIEFVIPANDDAKNGILLITKAIVDVFVQNRKISKINEKMIKDKNESNISGSAVKLEDKVVERKVEVKQKRSPAKKETD